MGQLRPTLFSSSPCPTDKEPFIALAADDKKRHKSDMENYTPAEDKKSKGKGGKAVKAGKGGKVAKA